MRRQKRITPHWRLLYSAVRYNHLHGRRYLAHSNMASRMQCEILQGRGREVSDEAVKGYVGSLEGQGGEVSFAASRVGYWKTGSV